MFERGNNQESQMSFSPQQSRLSSSIDEARYYMRYSTSFTNRALSTKNSGTRTRYVKMLRDFNEDFTQAALAALQAAIHGGSQADMKDFVTEYDALCEKFDAMKAELEDPRYLPVQDERRWFGIGAEKKRESIKQRGFEQAGILSRKEERGPFSLAYKLQRDGIIGSTREAAQLIIADGEIDRSDLALYVMRDRRKNTRE